MKLQKIKLNELADAELNEREMCRVLGGGTPGCCQCSCEYATSGGSSTSSNDSANNAEGLTSESGEQPCCGSTNDPILFPTQNTVNVCYPAQESTCPKK